jgi:alkanesulfonate monooxygenase SsuD/methylene tetrahydromethanopterin reductase-like flavin-dependent oxidoreductase (luciferase family)
MGAIGALTTTLRIRTNVFILSLRHPAAVAKALGTAAVVTNNRVELGVGVGHLRDEFDVLGADFHRRGRRTDEAIMALRALLHPGPVSYQGNFWDVPAAYFHPAPDAPVPIFVGGESQAALERAARLADGYASVPRSMEELESLAAQLKELRRRLAPDQPPLRLHLDCSDASTVDDYHRLEAAGAEVVKVEFGRPPDVTLAERLASMEQFAETIMAKV